MTSLLIQSRAVAFGALLCGVLSSETRAQATRDTVQKPDSAKREWGSIDPGNGALVAETDIGSVRISAYAMARYLNQLPGRQTYVDHLGQLRDVDPRQDIQWHRVMIHVLGWMYERRLTYAMTIWTVNATEQVRVVGNATYNFDTTFKLSVGINGIPGTRSLLNNHPLWLAPDRVMADEYFRPGFTGGLWASGALPWRFNYAAMIGNNISQLGVASSELTRDLAKGFSVWWLPTTGEFGLKGGYGDYDWHKRLAVRLGTSYTHSREDRAAQLAQPGPDNTQIRLSDGLLLFQTGSLAEGVTVRQANYDMSAVDLGFKYHGIFLQTEVYNRWLTRFDTDLPIPAADSSLYDHGYYIVGAFFPVKRKLELYGGTSQIFGSFNNAWEAIFGANWYPADTRWLRLNTNLLRVHRSPVGSVFGYYAAGLHGYVVSAALGLLF